MVLVKNIELNELGGLRKASAAMSALLSKRLNRYVETLSPLFSPRKVIGEYMQSSQSDRVPGADRNFAEIEEAYARIVKAGFPAAPKLRAPVPTIRSQLSVQPWEYAHKLESGREVWISSPNRWVLSYRSALGLSEFLRGEEAGGDGGADEIRDFLVRALVMDKLFDAEPALGALFADLRFSVEQEVLEARGGAPLVVLESAAPAFRPQDDVVESIVEMSGKPIFEELIDLEGVRALDDPLAAALAAAAEGR